MVKQLTLRLVIKNKTGCIITVKEMTRLLPNGKRDQKTLEWFLDDAELAITQNMIPTIEFPDSYK